MTVEAMAKVERRYSRKVGDSFRRDKEHLALFEELADHDDLDSSLGNLSPPPVVFNHPHSSKHNDAIERTPSQKFKLSSF